MIITVNASPVEGGTVESLLEIFEEEAMEIGLEIRRLDLRGYNIPPHDGNLERTPLDYHFIQDIRGSEGIVIASPTYWFRAPGHLCNFIDMLTEYINWDNDDVLLADKLAAIIAVAPGGGATNICANLALTLNTMGMCIPPYGLLFFGSQDEDVPENPNGWGKRHIQALAHQFKDYRI